MKTMTVLEMTVTTVLQYLILNRKIMTMMVQVISVITILTVMVRVLILHETLKLMFMHICSFGSDW